ncbi:MAG: tetratricopeptide repeat protein [Verrucomicrobiae bacterium]|nr:tetratricopeptide repeat protein [Verrucomicrobiae bacterium]
MTYRAAVLMLLAAVLAGADESPDDLAARGVVEFMAAYQAWDGERFDAATELFSRATTNASASAVHFYWLGTARFHRMLHSQNQPASRTNREAADASISEAVAALNRAVQLDQRHAESHALLGTLYGMRIDGSLLRAVRFGPRIEKHRKAALEHGPENPRVRYLLGVCQFHTARKPAGWREALATLLTAEKLFAAEARQPAGPLEPRWGYASCLTFIGRTYEQLGQREQAAEFFRRALALHPADHLASEGLQRVTAKNRGKHEQ